jgi:hypothetical protein
MVKGRRAADRRREREGDEPGHAMDHGTTPMAAPAHPHDDYEEVDDGDGPASVLDGDVRALDSSRLPVPERANAGDGPSVPKRVAKVIDDDVIDAEKSFARELKRRPREDTRAREGPEATEVREPKLRKPRRGGRFVVVAVDGNGTDGVELPILVFPALLGRTASAELHLDDPTVSLRHAEVAFDVDEGFSVVDLGSSSGTLKNGVVVDGRVALAAGDVVQVGKTELRFLPADKQPLPRPEPEPEPEPEPPPLEGTERLPERPEPTATHIRDKRRQAALEAEARRRAVRKKAALVIVGSALAFAVVAGGLAAYRAAFSDNAPAQIRLQVSSLLGEAKEHLLAGDVDGARARVGTILALDPGNAEATSLDRMVSTETQARDALQLALRLGDEDRDEEAVETLKRVADSSVFAKDRDRLMSSLAERGLLRSLRIVESLLDQGKVDDALARAQEHVQRFPADEGGKALLARVQQAKANVPRDQALFPARAAFADGRVDDAKAIAGAAGYVGYVKEIERFQKNLEDGKDALGRLDGIGARGPLDEAFRLLGALGGRASSPIFAQVQKPYADALYLSGTEKRESGDLCGAARDLYKAARVVPDDTRVQAEIQKLTTRAEQGLVKAQGAKVSDRERARSIAREHLCLAPSGTKLFDDLRALSDP